MTDSWLQRLATLAALVAACGCSDLGNCPEAQKRRTIPNEPGTTDVANLYFESAPWNGPLTPIPAKSELSFEHGLGVTPLLVKAYYSFTPDGTKHDDDGSVVEIAGNLGPEQCVDHKVIVISNDTCEKKFFVRVVAMGQSQHSDDKDHCPEPVE
jgi:hypothetical protein